MEVKATHVSGSKCFKAKNVQVHRWAEEVVKAEIPKGLKRKGGLSCRMLVSSCFLRNS